MFHLLGCESFHWRHVTEVPMVLTHAIFHRQMECRVRVVRGFVGLVHQWRSLTRAPTLDAVTGLAFTLIDALAESGITDKSRLWQMQPLSHCFRVLFAAGAQNKSATDDH